MKRIEEIPMYRRTKGPLMTIGVIVNNAILLIAAALSLLPILHIIAVSFSENAPANANLVGLIPIGFNLKAYAEAVTDSKMLVALVQTIKRTALGVPVNMILTILCAYPLSYHKKDFPMRTFYSGFVIFTMLFSGGLIPSYILMSRLNLMDTLWALVLPGIPVFNVIIMMNFFREIPEEIKEAAMIDGAEHFTMLTRIILPTSGAVLATLTLFCFVGHWNAWFDALIYMKDLTRYPLQNYIQTQVARMTLSPDLEEAKRLAFISRRSLLFARIFISIVPILIVYPFLQKYFQTGIIVGAVKG
ncbi:MAG: carbohydrate ABC transporter permease [Caldicoprobacterales bacterium]